MGTAAGANAMSPDVRAAYEAPFPDASFLAGARKFPSLVPIFPDDPEIPTNLEAWKVLEAFDKPFRTSFSDNDPVTAGMDKVLQDRVAGAKGVDHVTIDGPYAGRTPQDTPSRRRLFVCRPEAGQDEAACARTILTTLARRAFRRPATATDAGPYRPTKR
jgi:hypothetical protein